MGGQDSRGGDPDDPRKSEQGLLEAANRGEHWAHTRLFELYWNPILTAAVAICGADRAEDIAAEAFARVLRLMQEGRGPTRSFKAYVTRTVRNTYLNELRGTRREELTPDYSGIDDLIAAPERHDDRFSTQLLVKAFRGLPERWREVLWMSSVDSLTHREIGRRLGISANAVGVLAHRAREGLRSSYLAQHLGEVQDEQCRAVLDLYPAYVRGSLSAPRRQHVENHRRDCARCSAALLELRTVNRDLGAVLIAALPLLGSKVVNGSRAVDASASAPSTGISAPAAVGTALLGVAATTAAVALLLSGADDREPPVLSQDPVPARVGQEHRAAEAAPTRDVDDAPSDTVASRAATPGSPDATAAPAPPPVPVSHRPRRSAHATPVATRRSVAPAPPPTSPTPETDDIASVPATEPRDVADSGSRGGEAEPGSPRIAAVDVVTGSPHPPTESRLRVTVENVTETASLTVTLSSVIHVAASTSDEAWTCTTDTTWHDQQRWATGSATCRATRATTSSHLEIVIRHLADSTAFIQVADSSDPATQEDSATVPLPVPSA